MPTGSASVPMLFATALMSVASTGRATNTVAVVPGMREAATSHAPPSGDTAVTSPTLTAPTMLFVRAPAIRLVPCTAMTAPLGCTTPSRSPVPITELSSARVACIAAGTVTLWSAATWRPTPAMNVVSGARWPSIRLAAIDTLSAALLSAWARALASASISGTAARATPATRMTVANFSENDAPRQMPLNQRTPLIAPRQPERRTSTRDATAMVAATRTVESAMKSTAPRTGPPLLTGLLGGMVRAGGASTGGR